jgi:hypothetical protein
LVKFTSGGQSKKVHVLPRVSQEMPV